MSTISRIYKTIMTSVVVVVVTVLVTATAVDAVESGRRWGLAAKRAATITGDFVTLGEIVEPLGNIAPETWDEMCKRELWPAPPKGTRAVTVHKRQLESLLRRALGSTASRVFVRGSLVIQRGGQVFTSNQLKRNLVGFLTPTLSALGGEPEIRDFHSPSHLFVPDTFARLTFEPLEEIKAGRISVRMNAVALDGKILERATLSFFLDHWISVPCAMRPLNSGERLTPDLITHIRKNAAYLKGDVLQLTTAEDLVVNKPIGEGMVIYADNVRQRPVIAKGDKVQLLYKGKHLRLTAEAEALDDGALGKIILVRNLHSSRKVHATVWDSGTVVVR